MSDQYALDVILRAKQEGMGVLKEAEGSLLGLAKAGIAVGAVLAGSVAVGAYEAVKAAGKFQAAMELIKTQAGASQAEVDSMSKSVLALAGPTGTAPEILADALYHLESTGLRGAKALEALRISAEGAKVGQANLVDVTNALDAVLVAGVPEAKNMAGAMGELNAIVGAGDMKMQDLSDAMGTGILASAKVFGLGLKDVGAALAVMGDNNIRGSDAATKLRMSLALLSTQTPKAAHELKLIGITTDQLGIDMRKGGLILALTDLQTHLNKFGTGTAAQRAQQQADILSKAFGGGKSAGTIELLLEQLDRLKTKYADVGAGASGFADAWAATQGNLNFKIDAMKAAVDAAGIKIGTVLLPYVSQLLDKVTPLVPVIADWASKMASQLVPQIIAFAKYLQTLGPDLQKAYDIVKAWAPYVAAIAIGWAAWNVALAVTVGLQKAILAVQLAAGIIQIVRTVGLWTVAQWALNVAMDANPIGVVIIAIAALVAGAIWAYQNVKWFRDAVNDLADAFKGFASQFWADIGPIFYWIKDTLWPMIKQAAELLHTLGGNSGGGRGTNRAFNPRAGNVIPSASGFEGTVYKPTLFLAGEGSGPEDVSIRPLGAGGGSRGNITIVINGANMTNDQVGGIVARQLRRLGAT